MDRSENPNWMGGPANAPPFTHGKSTDHSAVVPAKAPPPPVPLTPPPFVEPPAAEEKNVPVEILPARERAKKFQKMSAGIYMGNVVGAVMSGMDDPALMAHYVHDLTEGCNAHTNPMQQLLVEQISLGHHRLCSLHCNSANANTPEAMIAYNAAAARLMAELRKSMLALQELQTVSMCGATFRKISKAQVKEITPEPQKHTTELTGNGTAGVSPNG